MVPAGAGEECAGPIRVRADDIRPGAGARGSAESATAGATGEDGGGGPAEERAGADGREADPERDAGRGGAAGCTGGAAGGAEAAREGGGQGLGGSDAIQRLQPELVLRVLPEMFGPLVMTRGWCVLNMVVSRELRSFPGRCYVVPLTLA
ncbi:unnamed protein product [Ranitomeya imitator]|uniref:Uncharacterized protein n=1 Tax=Ranitomeya imitator TaxID=111125 RepID=A0ABN9MA78_9NEOB|nr:unnamed protein product [Ranitomeya imitator]